MEENNRKNNGLYSISQTVMPLVKSVLGKKGFVEVDILTNWEKIVGSEMASCSIPEKIDFKKGQRGNGVLFLNVLSGAHALELKHKERMILDKVNGYFGYMAVLSLKIVQNSEVFNKEFVEVKENKTVVSKEEEIYIAELVKDVKNDGLRETLARLGKSIIADNKDDEK